MQLTLIRHGETLENKKRIVQGQSFGILNDDGINQAQQVGLKLKGKKFDYVYCSDLDRCVKTAQQINLQSGIKVDEFRKELRERSFGEFEGRSSLNLDWDSLQGDYMHKKPPGGESNLDLYNRVTNFINYIFSRHGDDNILIITHGGVIRIVQSYFSNESLDSLFKKNIKNAGIYKFEINQTIGSRNN